MSEALHNSDRAHHALTAINGYLTTERLSPIRQVHELSIDETDWVETWATDLLCDLRHLCDAMSIDWDGWLTRADRHYNEEREQEEEEQRMAKMEADSAALERIYQIIDGKTWDSGTIEVVAGVVASTGRFIHPPSNEEDR